MFILRLAIRNKMIELKKLFQSFNLFGPVSFALLFPWIIFKVLGAVYLKRRFNELLGKVVVITGASSGLGEALAHEFYKHGCQIVLCARRRRELERVRTDLLQMHCNVTTHPPIIIPLDLSDIDMLKNNVDKILSITGKIDILINNGGVSQRGSVLNTKIDVDMQIMMVNYFGSVALTKAVLPNMIKCKEGHIVFISSVQGLVALPDRSAYSASKHALQAFADSLRAEIASHNVSVSVISPGYIKTNLSLNALTETGSNHRKMDETTKSGYSPEYVAKKIAQAVVQKKKEVVVSTLLPKVAIVLRKYFPTLYFFAMEYRARKSQMVLKKAVNESRLGNKSS